MDKIERKFLNAFCNKMKWQFFILKLKLLLSKSRYLNWKLEPTKDNLCAYVYYKDFFIEFNDPQDSMRLSYYWIQYKKDNGKKFYSWKKAEQYIGQKIKEEKIGMSLGKGWSR